MAVGQRRLGQATKEEWLSFINQYDPALNEQLGKLDSTELIDDARRDSAGMLDRAGLLRLGQAGRGQAQLGTQVGQAGRACR